MHTKKYIYICKEQKITEHMLKISGVDKFTWTEAHKFKSLCPQFRRVISNTSNPRAGTRRPTPGKLMAKLIRIHFFLRIDSLQYCILWNMGSWDLQSGCGSVKSQMCIFVIGCTWFGSFFIGFGLSRTHWFMGFKYFFLFCFLLIILVRRSDHLYVRGD